MSSTTPFAARLEAAPRSAGPLLAALGAVLLAAGLLLVPWWTGSLALIRYGLPVLALAVGVVLYWATPVLYVGYVWWLWFLTPFLRRIVDYEVGWQDPNVLMLTPYLVSSVALFSLLRRRSWLLRRPYFAFLLVFGSIGYGYAVGMLRISPLAATYDLLQWGVPVVFGFHVATLWEDYPALRRCFQRTFAVGVVVMGLYAVVQFYLVPPWDAFWMVESEMGAIGRPYPFVIRVFSTMNAPAPFATMMMAGVLVLFTLPTWKHLLAAVPGYTGLLLTIVRSAWGGWVLALGVMAVWAGGRMRRRLVGVLLVGTLVLLPLTAAPPIADRLNERFATFENLGEDRSLNARLTLYSKSFLFTLANPFGQGIGAVGTAQKVAARGRALSFDSGLLMIPYLLGWPGLLLYLAGLALLARVLLRGRRYPFDAFLPICVAIGLTTLVLLLFRNTLIGATGVIFWGFLGAAFAGVRYHRAEETALADEPDADDESDDAAEVA